MDIIILYLIKLVSLLGLITVSLILVAVIGVIIRYFMEVILKKWNIGFILT